MPMRPKLDNMVRPILITLILLISLSANANPPDMRLVNISGTEESLSNHIGKGQWVVVNIWSPTCSACVIELPQIKKIHRSQSGNTDAGCNTGFSQLCLWQDGYPARFRKTKPTRLSPISGRYRSSIRINRTTIDGYSFNSDISS